LIDIVRRGEGETPTQVEKNATSGNADQKDQRVDGPTIGNGLRCLEQGDPRPRTQGNQEKRHDRAAYQKIPPRAAHAIEASFQRPGDRRKDRRAVGNKPGNAGNEPQEQIRHQHGQQQHERIAVRTRGQRHERQHRAGKPLS
jgi:hypothetical protein